MPPARTGLSPGRTSHADGIQLGKGPARPSDVATGRAASRSLRHLLPLSWLHHLLWPEISLHRHLLSWPACPPTFFSFSLTHKLPSSPISFSSANGCSTWVPSPLLLVRSFLSFSFSVSPFSLLAFSLFNIIYLEKNTSAANKHLCCACSSLACTLPSLG